MRVLTMLMLVGLVGCGRLGYNGEVASTDMSVTATSTEILVEAPGMYTLLFDEAHSWQASSWTDLTSDESVELAGTDHGGILQAPFAAQYGGTWYEIESADFTQRAIYELDADHVVFKVWYGWEAPDETEIEVWATYDIARDGTWSVSASLENKNSADKQFGVVFAQTSLSTSAEWEETVAGSSVTLDAASGARFEFVPAAGQSGTLESDGMGGFEFDAGIVDLGSYDTIDLTWTNRVVP